MSSILSLHEIHFSYSSHSILKNISLDLNTGESLWLRGPNGAGKTTLLKIMSGILRPSLGKVVSSKLSLFLGDLFFYEKMTLLENLNFYRQLQSVDSDFFESLVSRFALSDFWERPFEKLSRGERARGALVRALMPDVKLFLLDEPLSNLDDAGREILKDMFGELKKRNCSMVLVSHQDFGFSDWTQEYTLPKGGQ